MQRPEPPRQRSQSDRYNEAGITEREAWAHILVFALAVSVLSWERTLDGDP
jgi:hypothetical protein